MLICCSETFLIIINVENSCAASYFVETAIHFFSGYLTKRKFKGKHLFEIEIFCNTINVFIAIFYKFNASLLSKILISLKKNLLTLNHLNSSLYH